MKEMVAADVPEDNITIKRHAADKDVCNLVERKNSENREHRIGEHSESRLVKVSPRSLLKAKQEGHIHNSDLSKLCIINTQSLERLQPNGGPYFVDNEFFSGYVFLMVRPPDVASNKGAKTEVQNPEENEKQAKISNYFRDKLRRFEFQFQVKLKKLPPGPLYLGAEVEGAPKLNILQRALTNACLNVVKRLNNGFHFSLGLDEQGNVPNKKSVMEGTYENAHLAFAIESSMDVIIVSKPGDVLPKLGEPLHESSESVKYRRTKCRGSVDWNTEDTFTMAFWSCYVDWVLWQVMNFPGVPPFSISDLTSKQPIHLTLYSIVDPKKGIDGNHKRRNGSKSGASERHYRSYMRTYADFELSNISHSISHWHSKCIALQSQDVSPGFNSNETGSRNINISGFASNLRSNGVVSIESNEKDSSPTENSVFTSDSRSNSILSIDCLTSEPESTYDVLKSCTTKCGSLCFEHPLTLSP